MSAWPRFKNWREYVGGFSVEFEVSNYADMIRAREGLIPPKKIRRARLSGVVDTGASQLVLPAPVVDALGLPKTREAAVRFADNRTAKRSVVGDVWLEMLGRSDLFSALVEPAGHDALIGAIVLEILDFIPDCNAQKLVPRDPRTRLVEI